MKQLKTILSVLTIVAVILTTAACSTDDIAVNTPVQPVQPLTPSGISITVGAGFNDDQASNRSAVVTEGTKLALHFTEGDRLYIRGVLPEDYYVVGTLSIDVSSISADGKSARFSGDIQVYNSANEDVTASYPFPDPSDPLSYCTSVTANLYHKNMVSGLYTVQADKSLLYNESVAYAPDVETLMSTALEVKGDYTSATKTFALGSTNAIVCCTLSGLTASTAHKVRMDVGSTDGTPYAFTTDADGIGTIAFVTTKTGNYSRTITVLKNEVSLGTIDLGSRNFAAKVYNVLRYWDNPAFKTAVDLVPIYNGYTAKNGDILTGILGGGATNTGNLTIADGATVILHNVEITSVNPSLDSPLSGIDCLGNATIVLSGSSLIKGGAARMPAIYVPASSTLTIRGNGSLKADGTGCSAGIGGGDDYDAGNIVIAGGTVTAIGGKYSAAIGSGGAASRSCGNISISGGTVTASSTGEGAAIGSGKSGACGTITISGGNVVASSSYATLSPAAIGSGHNTANCGLITISGGTVSATSTGSGAGIGGGNQSGCSGILITGGTVNASSVSGAAIGSASDTGSSCGDITITNTVTQVTATKSGSTCSIGKGYGASCGTVTIGGTVYPDGITDSSYIYKP